MERNAVGRKEAERHMKLTAKEQEICDKYGARDEDGYVHCYECPLNLNTPDFIEDPRFGNLCYATIDGRRARKLKRYL